MANRDFDEWLSKFRPSISSYKLNRIVKKYEKDIDLNLIGFPKSYRELMYIKNLKNIT